MVLSIAAADCVVVVVSVTMAAVFRTAGGQQSAPASTARLHGMALCGRESALYYRGEIYTETLEQ